MPFNSGGSIVASLGAIKSSGEIVVRVDHDDELSLNALSTIRDYSKKIKNKNDIAGVLFPSIQPNSKKKISSLYEGEIFKYSYFMSKEKVCVDGVMALKGDIARKYFAMDFYTRTTLNATIWLEISKKYFFEFSGGEPILFYNRDNNLSQSNFIRISNKMVYSFARILDQHDRYYYIRPVKWLRYSLGLIHFSIVYYKSPFQVMKMFSNWSTKLWYILVIPFGMIAHFFKQKKFETCYYNDMDPNTSLKYLKEVRKE